MCVCVCFRSKTPFRDDIPSFFFSFPEQQDPLAPENLASVFVIIPPSLFFLFFLSF